jgi:hypothetical protein
VCDKPILSLDKVIRRFTGSENVLYNTFFPSAKIDCILGVRTHGFAPQPWRGQQGLKHENLDGISL